jgi:hypothetical protein
MDTQTRRERAFVSATQPSTTSPTRTILRAVAGPALIIGSVLLALRGIAFLPHLTDQHPDILSFWLPRSCMLGRALSAGHVPLWNPYEMAGTWFAADPQSGWLSLSTMGTSVAFGCGTGLRALIVLNPILAGLGLFWFLRREGLARVAATAGGLSLAMAISASIVAVSLPFAGTLAWTPFILVGASGFFSATGWRRLPWLALGALAWGQVATSHLSHGLVMATGLAIAYVIARAIREVRLGELRTATAVWMSLGFLAFVPLANLAILVPHFAVLARSSLSDGYGSFGGTVAGPLRGDEAIPIPGTGIWGAWPLALASTPGGYLGAAVLLFVPFALRDRGRRYLVLCLAAVFAVAYLLTSSVLVGAGWFRSLALWFPFGDVYLHNPSRLRYLAFLVVPVLGAIGIHWMLEHRPSFGEATRWIGAGLAVFLLVPLLMGARVGRLAVFAIASAAVIGVVWALARGRRWAPVALCLVLGAELAAGAVWSSMYQGGTVYLGLESGSNPALVAAPLRWPDVDLNAYLEPGPIATSLRRGGITGGRYLAWISPDATFNKGYLFTRKAPDWPALLIGRSVLFELPDTLGYSPVQIPGYWSYIHGINKLPVFYNASVVQVPTLSEMRMLGARYLVTRNEEIPRTLEGPTIAREGAYRLIEITGSEPRATLVPTWRIVPSSSAALDAAIEPRFDPARVAVLETDPGLPRHQHGVAGHAYFREPQPEDVRIDVDAPDPSILVVRNAWDEGWSATLDGRSVPLLRVDGFVQGVAVPEGRHQVRLVYREPAIGRGIALSALAWLGLAVVLAFALVRGRRRQASGASAGDHGSAAAPTGSTGA